MTHTPIQPFIKSQHTGFYYIFLLFITVMAICSCGNTSKKNNGGTTAEQSEALTDWDKEQIQLDASTKVHLDSLITEVHGIATATDSKTVRDVYAEYLLSPKQADEALTLTSQYAVLSMLMVDRQMAEAQNLPTENYDKACRRLISSINDPALLQLDTLVTIAMLPVKDENDLQQASDRLQRYHDKEVDAGRTSYFWTATLSSIIERLYLAINIGNLDLDHVTDTQACNISRHISIIVNNIKRIAEHDENIARMASVIEPFHELNANNSEDFKTQMQSITSRIGRMRKKLLEQ